MTNCSKGSAREREALAQDLKEGWTFMEGSRAVRTKYQANDLFGIGDYAVYRVREVPFFSMAKGTIRELVYERKIVQVCDEHNFKAHKENCAAWWNIHRNSVERIELAVYRDAHYEGRGKNKHWVKKSWRRELL